ncbi:MAG: hypothetical protein JNL70_16085 [Saprospiraceae bacterium]|nr:hypothetical protein [Saprospiraceae bacterium]
MEIRIAYHQSSETLMNRISELLKENGIAAELQTAKNTTNGDVRITLVKETENKMASELLDSSFVHVDHQPGY